MLTYTDLKKYIDCNDMIYIDTCSLGKKGIKKFYNNIKSILINSDKKIIIKEQVYDEVKANDYLCALKTLIYSLTTIDYA